MPRRSKKPKLEKRAGDSIPRQISSSRSCDTESPSVYLVVGHGVTRPAYSVFKVNPFSDGDGDTTTDLSDQLVRLDAKHCMSFVPVRSKHGSWIVGVGGNSARDYGPETIVFDTKTHDVIPGPKLLSTKFYPVVLPMGDKIYALARNPAVKGQVNFVPWFEVLDLSQAQVVDGKLVNCEWKDLPRPPFFPWDLAPLEYMFPPEVTIKSYVAVGSYILLSITGQMGTHMFDVEKKQWAKLDDKDLPFIEGAVPHGPLFLGLSGATKEITAYRITVYATAAPKPSIPEGCPSLSILEFPMVTDWEAEEEVFSSGRFVSLGNPGNTGFCSFRCCSDDPELGCPQHTQELLTMRAYKTEDPLSQDCCLDSIRGLVISNQWKQVYRVCDSVRRLTWPCLEDVISL